MKRKIGKTCTYLHSHVIAKLPLDFFLVGGRKLGLLDEDGEKAFSLMIKLSFFLVGGRKLDYCGLRMRTVKRRFPL